MVGLGRVFQVSARWKEELRADVPEPSTDSRRGEASGCSGLLPRSAKVRSERPGEAELGVRGAHQQGPAVSRFGCAAPRPGPAEGLLEESEGVFEIELAEECLQASVDVLGRAPVREDKTGLRSRSPGRWSACSPINVPSITGRSPPWSILQVSVFVAC